MDERRGRRVRRFILIAVLVAVVSLAHATPPATAADVHGDDARDEWVGTGGLVLPASVDDATRREVASCLGCHWRLTSPCVVTDAGRPMEAACTSVVRGCPGGELRRSWFQPAGAPWRETGLVCLSSDRIVTVRDIGSRVRDRLVEAAPALTVRAWPPRGVVTQLPTFFSTGQPPGLATVMAIAGEDVRVEASVTWSWDFGDGSGLTTLEPGGPPPGSGVGHTFRRARPVQVRCEATWRARFHVDGLGPFDVPETVQQVAVIDMEVGEGRAVLVPTVRPGE